MSAIVIKIQSASGLTKEWTVRYSYQPKYFYIGSKAELGEVAGPDPNQGFLSNSQAFCPLDFASLFLTFKNDDRKLAVKMLFR